MMVPTFDAPPCPQHRPAVGFIAHPEVHPPITRMGDSVAKWPIFPIRERRSAEGRHPLRLTFGTRPGPAPASRDTGRNGSHRLHAPLDPAVGLGHPVGDG